MKSSVVVTVLSLLFFVSEMILSLSRRSKAGAQSRDRGSLAAVWIIIMAGAGFGGFAANAWPQTRLQPYASWQMAGIILLLLGLALRWWSIVHLGRFFTVNVAVHASHRVVDSGPYRFIRHPSYSGAVLALLGLACGMDSWVSILSVAVASIVAYTWRIRVEEEALVSGLGAAYVRYQARTKRLIPGIF